MSNHHQHRKQIENRLARIEGHVRPVKKWQMKEENAGNY